MSENKNPAERKMWLMNKRNRLIVGPFRVIFVLGVGAGCLGVGVRGDSENSRFFPGVFSVA